MGCETPNGVSDCGRRFSQVEGESHYLSYCVALVPSSLCFCSQPAISVWFYVLMWSVGVVYSQAMCAYLIASLMYYVPCFYCVTVASLIRYFHISTGKKNYLSQVTCITRICSLVEINVSLLLCIATPITSWFINDPRSDVCLPVLGAECNTTHDIPVRSRSTVWQIVVGAAHIFLACSLYCKQNKNVWEFGAD